MTQSDIILELLQNNPTLGNIEISNITGFPQPSVRRITGTLTKQGILQRVGKGIYEINPEAIIFRHYISTSFYCSGSLNEAWAHSYKSDDIDIFQKLKRQLILKADDTCGSIPMVEKGVRAITKTDFNYSINSIPYEDRDFMAIYPNIITSFD